VNKEDIIMYVKIINDAAVNIIQHTKINFSKDINTLAEEIDADWCIDFFKKCACIEDSMQTVYESLTEISETLMKI